MQFEKGQSGNPAGRPPGARNRRTLLAEQLLDGRAEQVLTKIFGFADEGDPAAMRLLMERISPRLRERPVMFALPPLAKAADATAAMAAISQGLADGSLAAGEAADLSRTVDAFVQTLAVNDHEERLAKLEKVAAEIAKAADK